MYPRLQSCNWKVRRTQLSHSGRTLLLSCYRQSGDMLVGVIIPLLFLTMNIPALPQLLVDILPYDHLTKRGLSMDSGSSRLANETTRLLDRDSELKHDVAKRVTRCCFREDTSSQCG